MLVGGVCGVLVAHAAAYLGPLRGAAPVVQAHGHVHGHVHAAQGYWQHAALLAVLSGLCAVGLAAWAGYAARRPEAGPPRFARRLGGQTLWQVSLYVLMELHERLEAGARPGPMLSERPFLVGVALQVVVAALVLVALRGVERAAARLAERRPEVGPAARCSWRPRAPKRPALALLPATAAPRGPPAV